MRTPKIRRIGTAAVVGVLVLGSGLTPATAARASRTDHPNRAAVITVWNRAMIDALEESATTAPVAVRVAAIVQTSVFDAVNGVTHQYRPYLVRARAPRHSSARAAAIGAAYESLVTLFPAREPTFDALKSATSGGLGRRDAAIGRGLAWGRSVADQTLASRAKDGLTATVPPYVASSVPGRWQPTPPLFGPPAFRQFATMTPWAIVSPSAFRPPPPPALTSARYAADYAEVKAVGSLTSTTRTVFDTQTAQMWASDVPAAIWDRVADSLIDSARGARLSLTSAARLLALTNISMGDALISIWNSKNYFDTWRPVTAIHAGAADGNPSTTADPAWQPLLVTPPFQEYPAGHPGVSEAAAAVLTAQFGDATPFSASSALLPTVVRVQSSFSGAIAQVVDARVFGGMHFRSAGTAAVAVGRAIAERILRTEMRRSR